MKLLKIFRNLILLFLCIAGCTGLFLLGQGYVVCQDALSEEPLEKKIEAVREDRNYTSIGDLPEMYKNAVLAVEDHRFYEHHGIDPIGIGRALLHDLRTWSLEEGGSTITQQTAKNLYFSQEKEIRRKAAELWMAFEMEKVLSKDTILELYVNTIYFGDGYYGIGEAAGGYFGKSPGELTDSEAVLLAGITNAPSAYALSRHADRAIRRQQQVLDRMVVCGYLGGAEAETLIWDPVSDPIK
ncbi:MAG: transglycosylase domain-containing protein [Fusicatenibacter sp.]